MKVKLFFLIKRLESVRKDLEKDLVLVLKSEKLDVFCKYCVLF